MIIPGEVRDSAPARTPLLGNRSPATPTRQLHSVQTFALRVHGNTVMFGFCDEFLSSAVGAESYDHLNLTEATRRVVDDARVPGQGLVGTRALNR